MRCTKNRIITLILGMLIIPCIFAMPNIEPPDANSVALAFKNHAFLSGQSLAHLFHLNELFFLIRLLVAVSLGCMMGFSHSFRRPFASTISLPTFGAVSLGAASFCSINIHLFLTAGGAAQDALVNLGSIITGIGFLCGAVIFKQGLTVKGLSTATTLWASAAVGTACGCNMYGIAILTTFLIAILHRFENTNKSVNAKHVSELPD